MAVLAAIDAKHFMSPELSRLHSLLNSETLVPNIGYRRNKLMYELVCYVNCLIGCVLSNRRDTMPILVQRCREFMDSHVFYPEAESYYSVVSSYLIEVEREFELEKSKADA